MRNLLYKATVLSTILLFGAGYIILAPLHAAAKDGSDDQASSSSSSSSGNSGDSSTSSTSQSSDQQKSSDSSGSNDSQKSGDSNKGNKDQNKTEQDQEIEVEHQQNNEHDVHQELMSDQRAIDSVDIPDIDSTDIRTFDDASHTIDNLQQDISNIQNSLNLFQATTPLTTADEALLRTLTAKHQGDTDTVKARINDLTAQLQSLKDLLKQFSGQQISSDSGLRSTVIQTIKNFRDEAKDLSNLSKLDVQLVDSETK